MSIVLMDGCDYNPEMIKRSMLSLIERVGKIKTFYVATDNIFDAMRQFEGYDFDIQPLYTGMPLLWGYTLKEPENGTD